MRSFPNLQSKVWANTVHKEQQINHEREGIMYCIKLGLTSTTSLLLIFNFELYSFGVLYPHDIKGINELRLFVIDDLVLAKLCY